MTLSAWLAAGPGVSAAQTGSQIRRVDESVLKSAGDTGDEWLTYGLTQGETRFSPLNQISASP